MKSIVDDDGDDEDYIDGEDHDDKDDEDYIDGEDHDDEDDDNKLYEDNFSFCTDDASSSDEEEFESENTEERISKCWMNCQNKSTKLNMEIMSSGQRWMNSCTSVTDEITMKPLPPLHICHIAQDGKTRHCFTLETLYKIAMTSNAIENRSGETKKLQFLQPPHFITPMEDDLIDQISCRFGRGALNIEGSEFYKKQSQPKSKLVELGFFREDHFSPSEFKESLNRYMARNMVGDIYCCPLCYNEAHRRVCLDGKPENDENDADLPYDNETFNMDPMTILSKLDGGKLCSASTFCFQKAHLVKRHLRDVHGVDTSTLDGNELFHRFKIRASDGLLQRYLVKLHNRMLKQDDMTSYWFQGHNQSYIYLRQLINRRALEVEAAEINGVTGSLGGADSLSEFGSSFKRRERRIWRRLSAPYKKELDGALERESEGTRDEGNGPMKQLVEDLRRRRKRRDVVETDQSEEDSSLDTEEDLVTVIEPEEDDYEDYDGDEDDEWLKRPALLARRSSKEEKTMGAALPKRKGEKDQAQLMSQTLINSPNLTPSKKRNSWILLDSDDESLEVI